MRRFARTRAVMKVARELHRPGTPGLGERLAALPRMLRARVRGEYDGLSWGRLAMLAGGVAYIVSPVDLVPELMLLAVGVIDDLGVAAWLVAALLVETDRFLDWERERRRVVPGQIVTPNGAPEPGAPG